MYGWLGLCTLFPEFCLLFYSSIPASSTDLSPIIPMIFTYYSYTMKSIEVSMSIIMQVGEVEKAKVENSRHFLDSTVICNALHLQKGVVYIVRTDLIIDC